jgi:hypothetical protein
MTEDGRCLTPAPLPSQAVCRTGHTARHTGTASGHSGSPRPPGTSAYRSGPSTSPVQGT